jgi:hypothetical protein
MRINMNSIETFMHQIKKEKHAIEEGPASAAASFAFWREPIIPKMFLKILESAKLTPELDGEEHGDLSLQLVTEICADDPKLWQTEADIAQSAIHARIYSAIEMDIQNKYDT